MGEYAPCGEELHASGMQLVVVAARFNEHITTRLVEGARATIASRGGSRDLDVYWVPGAFEIPLVAKQLAATGAIDGVICLGAVVRGGTPHFEYVASACATGVETASLETGVPMAFGVLTTDDEQQALDRAGGREGNKGAEAALTAIEMVALLRRLPSAPAPGGRC